MRNATISRRGLVEGCIGVAALACVGALGSASRAYALEQDLLRPPGGQDQRTLFQGCIRCDRCRSACPHDAIRTATVEDGLIGIRTPKLDFRKGYCDACDDEYRCIASCPTGALSAFDRTTQKIGIAVIDTDKCLTYSTSGTCSAQCVDACPEDAFSFDEDGHLLLDEDPCWGCGACEYVCPSNAYGSYDGSKLRGINIQFYEA